MVKLCTVRGFDIMKSLRGNPSLHLRHDPWRLGNSRVATVTNAIFYLWRSLKSAIPRYRPQPMTTWFNRTLLCLSIDRHEAESWAIASTPLEVIEA